MVFDNVMQGCFQFISSFPVGVVVIAAGDLCLEGQKNEREQG